MKRGAIWSGVTFPQQKPDVVQLAVDTAMRIADRPSTIVISRLVNGVTIQLPPQTVRIEVVQNVRTSNEVRSRLEGISIAEQYLVVIGFLDHPTIPNTDLRYADLFFYQARMFEALELITTVPGRLLVSAMLTV